MNCCSERRDKAGSQRDGAHPHFQQKELFDYCVRQNIVPIGFAPWLAKPARRDRTESDTAAMEDPVIKDIAKSTISSAAVCSNGRSGANTDTLFNAPRNHSTISLYRRTPADEEMEAISGIDKNCRLVKGQVFLWKGAKDWTDLWDS